MGCHFVTFFHRLLENASHQSRKLVEGNLSKYSEKIQLVKGWPEITSTILDKNKISSVHAKTDSPASCQNSSESKNFDAFKFDKQLKVDTKRTDVIVLNEKVGNGIRGMNQNHVKKEQSRKVMVRYIKKKVSSKQKLVTFKSGDESVSSHCQIERSEDDAKCKNSGSIITDPTRKSQLFSTTDSKCRHSKTKLKVSAKSKDLRFKEQTTSVYTGMPLRSGKKLICVMKNQPISRKERKRSMHSNSLESLNKIKTKAFSHDEQLKKRNILLQKKLEDKKKLREERVKRYRENRERLHNERLRKLLKIEDVKLMQESQISVSKMGDSTFNLSSENSKTNLNSTTIITGLVCPKIETLVEENLDISSYEISPLRNSEVDSDSSASQKPIPRWAIGLTLKKALLKQFQDSLDGNKLFGKLNRTVHLAEVFGDYKYRQRTSSAIWPDTPHGAYTVSNNGDVPFETMGTKPC